MAKRRIRAAELAGLAALGAFGHTFFGPGRDRKPGERPASEVPVDYRGTDRAPAAISESPAASRLQETFMGLDDVGVSDAQRAAAIREGQNVSAGELAALAAEQNAMLRGYDDMYANRAQRAAQAAAAPVVRREPASIPQLLATDADFMPSRLAQAPVIGPRSEGIGGPTAAEMAAYRRQQQQDAMRGRGLGRVDVDPRSRPVVPRSRPMTREELINQIPTGGNATATGGRQVTGSEFSRNMANILAAFGPTRLAGFGNAAVEAATARGALQRAGAAQAARTDAARRGQTPTNLTSTKSTSTARANEASKRTKKFDEEEANVEFKRGGKTNSKLKKMASGGMSSASKRGDGIASKGKTKCKMY